MMLANGRIRLWQLVLRTAAGWNPGGIGVAVLLGLVAATPRALTAAKYSISGTVSGSAATVTLSGTSSGEKSVAAGGTYTFSGLADGSYTVKATRAGDTFSPVSRAVKIDGANVTGVNFAGKAVKYSISGTVSGSAATVTLSGASSGEKSVAAGGTYTFSGLADGSYVESASEKGFTFSPSTAAVTIKGANVTGINFTATPVPPSVLLSWNASASPDISGYDVYRSATSGGPYKRINSSLVAETSYVDTSVVADGTYYYVVTAVNGSGTQSGDSNQVTASVP